MKIWIKSRSLVLLSSLVMASSLSYGNSFEVDTKSSAVNWVGSKIASEHNGKLNLESGNFELSEKQASGTFVFDLNSITNLDLDDKTYNDKLVGHLKSEDFFDVKKFPTAKFELFSAKAEGSNLYQFKGNLTIKGITKEITFKGNYQSTGDKSHLTADVVFDRTDFDLKYNSKKFFDPKALGDKLILDEIKLKLDINATKKGPQKS